MADPGPARSLRVSLAGQTLRFRITRPSVGCIMSVALACPTCHATILADDKFCAGCGARLSDIGTPAPVGDPLLQKLRGATLGYYDIHSELGRGGMAAVYLAYDLRLQRKVAIKVMFPELMLSSGMAERFMLEARTAARLAHPNIVVIHAVSHSDDLYYFVMSLVEGATLEDVVRQQRRVPLAEVRWIITQAARALLHAHGEGVVHRDVKPANILVSTRGDIVLSDFGIAKASQAPSLTRTGSAVGTPSYMSPEQVLAEEISGSSDQYALGVVAYEMLAGQPPFRGPAIEVQWAHVHRDPPSLVELAPDAPRTLADTVMRMLTKRPADRWPSLEAVIDEFSNDLGANGGTARTSLARQASALQSIRSHSLKPTPHSPIPQTTVRPITRERSGVVLPISAPAPAIDLVGGERSSASPSESTDAPHELEVGETLSLGVESENGAADAARFESTDRDVIDVDARGLVTARASGSASVLIVADDGIARVSFMVRKGAASSLAPARLHLAPADVELEAGATVQILARTLDVAGHVTESAAPTKWIARDTRVVTSSSDGLLTAIASGRATVMVTAGSVSSEVHVHVVPALVARITVSPERLSMTAQSTSVLDVALIDRRGRRVTDRGFRVESEDRSIATVTAAGVVRGVSAGRTRVLIACEDVSIAVPVVIEAAAVASLTLTPPSLALDVGDSEWVRVTMVDDRGVGLEGRAVRWTGDQPHIATVEPSGRVTAHAPGHMRITASAGTASQTLAVSVAAVPVALLHADVVTLTLWSQRSREIKLEATDTKGRPAPATATRWRSDNPAVARVEAGAIVAGNVGSTRLTGELDRARIEITVRVVAAPIAGVTIDEPAISLAVSKSRALRARVTAPDGLEIFGTPIDWKTSAIESVSVDPSGMVVAHTVGTATITASAGGYQATTTVGVLAQRRVKPRWIAGGVAAVAALCVLVWAATRPESAPPASHKPNVVPSPVLPTPAVASSPSITDLNSNPVANDSAVSASVAAEATPRIRLSAPIDLRVGGIALPLQLELLRGKQHIDAADVVVRSSDPSIVSIANDRTLQAHRAGRVTISATFGTTTRAVIVMAHEAINQEPITKRSTPAPPFVGPTLVTVTAEEPKKPEPPPVKSPARTIESASAFVRAWLGSGSGKLPGSMSANDFNPLAEIVAQKHKPSPTFSLSQLTDESVVATVSVDGFKPSGAEGRMTTVFRLSFASRVVELIRKPSWDKR